MSTEKKLRFIAKRIAKTSGRVAKRLEKLNDCVEKSLATLSPEQKVELYQSLTISYNNGLDNIGDLVKRQRYA